MVRWAAPSARSERASWTRRGLVPLLVVALLVGATSSSVWNAQLALAHAETSTVADQLPEPGDDDTCPDEDRVYGRLGSEAQVQQLRAVDRQAVDRAEVQVWRL